MPNQGSGLCSHCGITHSCCWRRGPTSKPVLCNACGSRYLVKKSLDGYVPIQLRAGGAVKTSPKPSKPKANNNSKVSNNNSTGVQKPKRSATKRLDASTWYTETYDSEVSDDMAYFAEESPLPSYSGNSTEAVVPTTNQTRQKSLLGDSARSSQLLHITTQDQLSKLYSGSMPGLSVPSMRLKPRKPLNPSVSVVF